MSQNSYFSERPEVRQGVSPGQTLKPTKERADRIFRRGTLPPAALVGPEASELDDQGVGEEDIARAAVLGDLRPRPDPVLRPPVRGIDIADVQA
jgi:hypothetical protein